MLFVQAPDDQHRCKISYCMVVMFQKSCIKRIFYEKTDALAERRYCRTAITPLAIVNSCIKLFFQLLVPDCLRILGVLGGPIVMQVSFVILLFCSPWPKF